jgi:hypothetical protein
MVEKEMNLVHWTQINAAASIFAASCFFIIAIHPRIKVGPVIYTGLVACIFSLLATAAILLLETDDRLGLNRSGALLRIGLSLICVGVFIKASVLGSVRRKSVRQEYGLRDTRSIIQKIAEPVSDLANFLSSDSAPLEYPEEFSTPTNHKRRL